MECRLPKVYIVGTGPGDPSLLTVQARELISRSDVLIGASRMAESIMSLVSPGVKVIDVAARLEKVAEQIRLHSQGEVITVLVSGDSGFFSLAKLLQQELKGEVRLEQICGISSLQYLCAKLGTHWQDVEIVSLHGREHELSPVIRSHVRTFVLAGGKPGVHQVCRELCDQGWGHLTISVGERLSYPEERIITAPAFELVKEQFDNLSVMLIENRQAEGPGTKAGIVTPGIPDQSFIRGNSPMTKEEVRTVAVSKLRLAGHHVIYDIGAGTGSVALECGRLLSSGRVYAIEREEEAIALIRRNGEKFGLANLTVIHGEAPEGLDGLPVPDRVFIGGSGGRLKGIVERVWEKNPHVRLVINAITVETVYEAVRLLEDRGLGEVDIVQLSVAKGRKVGESHLMMAQNPVYIISAGGEDA